MLLAFTSAVASPEPLLRNSGGLTEQVKARLTAVPVATATSGRAEAAAGASPALAAAGSGPKSILSAPAPSTVGPAAPHPVPHR
ncbi:hypothetical protein Kpho01_61680 [Kitasatospora phosalacinea]|uniref:Uncharacterized protein n=1 Tax=Kitasatospora phosalacinea TaxID=2065 RepID=A0A9W6PNC0_9ACTN|nr:hypothetical protein Kpho01_61680 [Kitasatospora phosalacinea]